MLRADPLAPARVEADESRWHRRRVARTTRGRALPLTCRGGGTSITGSVIGPIWRIRGTIDIIRQLVGQLPDRERFDACLLPQSRGHVSSDVTNFMFEDVPMPGVHHHPGIRLARRIVPPAWPPGTLHACRNPARKDHNRRPRNRGGWPSARDSRIVDRACKTRFVEVGYPRDFNVEPDSAIVSAK